MPKQPYNHLNLVPFCGKVSKNQRENQNGHKSAVVWLTGLPASGKTTIAIEVELRLFQKKVKTFILDGDNIRQGLSSDLGFSNADRMENTRRVGEVTKLFSEAGFIIIVSIISPIRECRDQVRDSLPAAQFIEVFVDCPLEECVRRDPKGLYAMANKGEIPFFTGVSSAYEAPLHPEIHLKTHKTTEQECTDKIMAYLEQKGYMNL